MIWLLSVALAGTSAGTVLPSAPSAAPGRSVPAPEDPLRVAIDARTQGDLPRAAWAYAVALADKKLAARTRAAVHIALGLVLLDLGDTNLASANFTRARTSGTPVAPWGAWYEAWADHLRGRHDVAARECAAYRASWPDGPHADECLVLIGDAYVAAGQRGSAIAAYQSYLTLHPDTPREETLRLGIALAVSNTDPSQAIPLLQSLALDHAYHSSGETARRRLDELVAQGHPAALPDTLETRMRTALERKRCGYETEAWSMYQGLAAQASDDPRVQAWIDAQEERFSWGTKQYEALAARFAEAYAVNPSASVAWNRYKALAKAGMWADAVDQLQAGIKDHPTSGQFRGLREKLARGQLLAGRYADARTTWTDIGKSGGGLGREARWLAAFAAVRMGDHADALARLDAVIAAGGEEADAGRYYRARTLEALGRTDEAAAQRAEIIEREPMSWYASLLRSQGATPDGWIHRDGRWPGTPPPTLPVLARVETGGVASARPITSQPSLNRAVDWTRLAWNASLAPVASASSAPASASPTSPDVPDASTATASTVPPSPGSTAPPSPLLEVRPDSYRPSFLFDPTEGDRLLLKLAADHPAATWAGAAADLARAGVFVASAPLVARLYDSIEAAQDGADIPDGAALARIDLDVSEWRQIFLFARDDNHATRFTWGTQRLASTESDRLVALRHQFPTAEIDALHRHGEAYDVDPLLVLGLMRQESVYKQWALSPVGAIGLMQVMPRTGARVAALMGDSHYSPEQLEDPSTNVRYGVWYLSRLLDRFHGAWPLAVGSYNGGPHNVSAWLRPWGENIGVDDFVEQIPYPETRGYIKKVSGYYQTYLALYGPPGADIVVPARVTGDDPAVIDF